MKAVRVSLPEMTVKGVSTTGLTPGACAEFEGVLTASVVDRDNDLLEAKGAVIDPSMPLLWQHDGDKPLGRLLRITHRDDHAVRGRFLIADTPLGQDAKKLIEVNALRLSIGFNPLEFEPRKKGDGWLVKRFEIMECSLVSVPSNTAAVIESYQKGRLQSSVMKSWAAAGCKSCDHVGVDDPGEPSDRDPYESKNYAVHEAIHAVLCEVLDLDFDTVSIRPTRDSEGHVRLKNSTRTDPERIAADRAEMNRENNYTIPVSRDLRNRLEAEICMSMGPAVWGADGVDCSDSDIRQAREDATILELSTNPREPGRSIIKRCARVAAQILANPDVRSRVKRLARQLVLKKSLTRREVRALAVASEMEQW